MFRATTITHSCLKLLSVKSGFALVLNLLIFSMSNTSRLPFDVAVIVLCNNIQIASNHKEAFFQLSLLLNIESFLVISFFFTSISRAKLQLTEIESYKSE